MLRAWVPPVSCQKLNPVSLIHGHVSCPLCLSTDTLNTEFWESDSELHSHGLSIYVHIPNWFYVLTCSERVSLFRDSCLIFLGHGICSFRFSWQRDLNLTLCLLPLAFSLCSGMFSFPETCLLLSVWENTVTFPILCPLVLLGLWPDCDLHRSLICREWDFWENLLLMFLWFFPLPFPSIQLNTFAFHLASI